MSLQESPDQPITPESLWDDLIYYIGCLFRMFGTQYDVAEKHTLSRKEHFHLRNWLFRCEEFLRRLLFLDAHKYHHKLLTLPPTLSGASRSDEPGAHGSTKRDPIAFDPEHPEQWRVTFQLSAYAPRASRQRTHCARTTLPSLLNWHTGEFIIQPTPPLKISGPPASSRHLSTQTEPCRQDAGGPQLREPRLVYDAYPLARRIEALYRAAKDRVAQGKRMARWLAKQNTETLERFTKPTLSRQRLKTIPGDLAVEDAARFVAEIFDDFCMLLLGAQRVDTS